MWEKAIEAIRKSSPNAKVYIGCDSVRTRIKQGVWERLEQLMSLNLKPEDVRVVALAAGVIKNEAPDDWNVLIQELEDLAERLAELFQEFSP